MTTEFWNVPAALAWIAAKDEGICKRLQSKGNATFIDVIAEVRPKYPDIACPTRALTLELEERLRAGEVTSHAVRNQSGRREPIPPLDWPGLSLTVGPNGSGVVAESGILSGLKLVLSEILISVDDIKRIWPPKAGASTQASVLTQSTPTNGASPAKKRGRSPYVREPLKARMRDDIASGKVSFLDLQKEKQKVLCGRYHVKSRTTLRDAMKELMAENVANQIPTFSVQMTIRDS